MVHRPAHRVNDHMHITKSNNKMKCQFWNLRDDSGVMTLATIAEDVGSVSRTHMVAHSTITPVPKDWMTSFDFQSASGIHIW